MRLMILFTLEILVILVNMANIVREGVKNKNKSIFQDFVLNCGWVWVKSTKIFSDNTHSLIYTANIQKCPDTYCGSGEPGESGDYGKSAEFGY